MDVEHADRDWGHLYPAFRAKLEAVLAEMHRRTGEEWILVEGYRSQARQTWLYAQGRTRPGPVVTWIEHPAWHGAGLAADVMPQKTGYKAPLSWWQTLLTVGIAHGLANPAFANGDHGHLQIADKDLRPAALAWVERGFKD